MQTTKKIIRCLEDVNDIYQYFESNFIPLLLKEPYFKQFDYLAIDISKYYAHKLSKDDLKQPSLTISLGPLQFTLDIKDISDMSFTFTFADVPHRIFVFTLDLIITDDTKENATKEIFNFCKSNIDDYLTTDDTVARLSNSQASNFKEEQVQSVTNNDTDGIVIQLTEPGDTMIIAHDTEFDDVLKRNLDRQEDGLTRQLQMIKSMKEMLLYTDTMSVIKNTDVNYADINNNIPQSIVYNEEDVPFTKSGQIMDYMSHYIPVYTENDKKLATIATNINNAIKKYLYDGSLDFSDKYKSDYDIKVDEVIVCMDTSRGIEYSYSKFKINQITLIVKCNQYAITVNMSAIKSNSSRMKISIYEKVTGNVIQNYKFIIEEEHVFDIIDINTHHEYVMNIIMRVIRK